MAETFQCVNHYGLKMAAEKSFPGEPGILLEGSPPFVAEDEITAWLFSLNRKGIRPGLVRIQSVLSDLGNPHHNLKSIVTCGTNGKGSTTRIISKLLQDSGKKVATYTSPHLLRVYERISINDIPVDSAYFAEVITRIKPLIEKHQASWFETLTVAAILISSEAEVDIICCETGLGGRLDATNILTPEALLLTTVALDHQHILGETIPEIAAEKLGLLKENVPLFTAVKDELKQQVFSASVAAKSKAYFLDELTDIMDCGDRWNLVTRTNEYKNLPNLGTAVMNKNAALAILTLEEISIADLPSDIAASLESVYLPGRFQKVKNNPDWFVDTAHNEQALEIALSTFQQLECNGKKLVVFGGMADKVPGDIIGELLADFDKVIFSPISLPRSRNRDQLNELITRWRLPNAAIEGSVVSAMEKTDASITIEDKVLITGSCFMVGEALHRMGVTDLEAARITE